MPITWFWWIQRIQIGILLCLLGGIFWVNMEDAEGEEREVSLPPPSLPQQSVRVSEASYEAIGEPFIVLNRSPLTARLPDLRRHLVYYGRNSRPDADPEKATLHFAFNGNQTLASVTAGQRLYLTYDKKLTPPQYIFSPANKPTSLWMEAKSEGAQAVITVGGRDEQGNLLTEPKAHAQFALAEKEYGRLPQAAWELAGLRVDGTLLVRQKARWFGTDKFLEEHGGEEFADYAGKQRLDFTDGENGYSVYLGFNNCLIWKEGRWQEVLPGEASIGYPLISLKKIEDRLMTMELWDPEGKSKIALNLLKGNEAWIPQLVPQNFKYVGTRTRSQFIFEIQDERVLLSPHDWLLYSQNTWKKLQTPEEIDAYVSRESKGLLFIFEGMERRDGVPVMVAKLFNNARCDVQTIELAFQNGSGNGVPVPRDESKKTANKNNLEQVKVIVKPSSATYNDDDDDDDDDEDEDLDDEDLED